jgi:hypothetical protein
MFLALEQAAARQLQVSLRATSKNEFNETYPWDIEDAEHYVHMPGGFRPEGSTASQTVEGWARGTGRKGHLAHQVARQEPAALDAAAGTRKAYCTAAASCWPCWNARGVSRGQNTRRPRF